MISFLTPYPERTERYWVEGMKLLVTAVFV